MATTTAKRLADSQQLTASAAAVVTNAAVHDTIITHITLYNPNDDRGYLVTLWRVPDSGGAVGTAADANEVLEVTVDRHETKNIPVYWVLEDTNDTLQGKAETNAKINISVDGYDIA